MSYSVVVDNQEFFTGLQMPKVRPETFALFADNVPLLTKDQIAKIITDPNRVKARDRFKAEIWIKNQGSRGSCNGYAGAKALERARVLRGLEHIPLSGEGLYAQINGGRDNGSMLDDGMHALTENGVPPESLVKHQTYLWRDISPEAREAMKDFKGVECYRADTELELASGLALGFVGVVAVHVDRSYSSMDQRGVSRGGNGPGNHAVITDDLRISDTGVLEFDQPNSWGLNWADRGRIWLTWERHLRETNKYHAFYLIRSTIDGKFTPPLPKV